jgi:sulfur-oxidizing protein SoxY
MMEGNARMRAVSHDAATLTRRSVIASGIAILAAPIAPSIAAATPESLSEAMQDALGAGALLKPGRVRVELPPLAENGNSVPLKVMVDSPMTATDYVQTIFVFSERNPVANVAQFHLGPRSGSARVQTSIRLAAAQRITVVARTSDGSLWTGGADVIVTQNACLDDS